MKRLVMAVEQAAYQVPFLWAAECITGFVFYSLTGLLDWCLVAAIAIGSCIALVIDAYLRLTDKEDDGEGFWPPNDLVPA